MSGEQSFSTAELASLQTAQEGHMMDTCVRLVYTPGVADAYGKPAESWVDGATLSCGFYPGRSSEVMHWTEVVLSEAQIRLPITTSLNNRDRLRVTHRHGVAITAETYEIVGQPLRGPSGLLLNLRKVTES